THLIAELVLRICQQKALDGTSRVSLRLFPANVWLYQTPAGQDVFLEPDQYLESIRGYLGFMAVRRGLAGAAAAWRLEELYVRSGRKDPEIQLCDVLSHASHDDCHPCQESGTIREL